MDDLHIMRTSVEEDEEPVEGMRLKLFPYSGHEIYYEIFLSDTEDNLEAIAMPLHSHQSFIPSIADQLSQRDESSIQFIHNGVIVTRKRLSKVEISVLDGLIDKLSLRFRYKISEDMVIICPHIESSLQIESANLTAFISWSNADRESFADDLKSIIALADCIENLIDIDFEGLEMPIFM